MGTSEKWGGRRSWTGDALKDLTVALRTLRASPGYTSAVIAILALGIGAIASAFTVANGVLLRPLPYADSEELTLLWSVLDQSTDPDEMTVSPADFTDWQAEASSFEAIAAHNLWFPVLSGEEGDSQSILAGLVTPGLFPLLGVQPVLGRTFGPEEGDGSSRVVVLSHGLWQSRYGGDPGVVGRDVRLNGLAYQVVGVLPADYRHPDPHRPLLETQLFAPFDMSSWPTSGSRFLRVFGRLSEGTSIASAQAEMVQVARRLETVRPVSNRDVGVVVRGMREQFFASVRPALLLAVAGAGLLFLIVCANVANLALSRSLARRREFAVRASLGAGRGRIARHILLENGLLALGGSLIGVGAVMVFIDVLRGLQGRVLPTIGDIQIDGWVVLFSVGVVAATTLLLGVLPLTEFARTPVRAVLIEEGGGTGGSRRSQRIRSALVIGEIAVAGALVVGAGLLGSSFQRLTSVSPGFDAPRVLTVELSAPRDRYESAADFVPMYEELGTRLAALPGVERVSYASELPLLDGNWTRNFDVVDRPREEGEWPTTEFRIVAPGYFEAMGIDLHAGRGFERLDRGEAPRVVVVNLTLARQHWPDGNAVGRFIRWRSGDDLLTAEIVGIVGDVLDDGLDAQPDPLAYYPYAQSPNRSVSFALRTAGDPAGLVASVRQAIRDYDGQLPVDMVAPYQARIMETVTAPRLASTLSMMFSVLALAIAGLGIYGVVAYAVGARTREIGIRAALGAGRGEVAGMVLRQSLKLALIGAAAGLVLAVVEGKVLASLLFQTPSLDPISYLLAPGLLVLVALVAAFVPARRAVTVDPVQALRSDGR